MWCPGNLFNVNDKDDKDHLDDHSMAGKTPCFTMFVDIRSHLGRESLLRLGSKERSKENHDCGFHLLSIFVTFVDFKQLSITLANIPQSRPTFVSELILESFPGDWNWRELEQISPPLNSLIVACLSPNAWLSHAWLPRRTTSLPTLPSVDPPTLY